MVDHEEAGQSLSLRPEFYIASSEPASATEEENQ